MPFRQYDCQNSTAISRIAFNKHKNELIIEFYPSPNSPLTAYHYTHIRLPRDEVEMALLNYQSLGEYINTQIKPNSRFQQISSFPTNIRPPRNTTPNYSSEWIAALEARNLQRNHLELMLQVLSQCNPKDPPGIPPPSPPTEGNFESGAEAKENGHEASTNPFAELNSEDENSDIEREDNSQRNPRRASITMQSRYIFGRVICGIGELLRDEAVLFLRNKDYANSSLHWSQSYDQLFKFANSHVFLWASGFYQSIREDVTILDHFNINDYFSNPEASAIIFDMHNIRQLYEFLNAYEILLMDTERQKSDSLRRLHTRAQYVSERLNPMLQDRDVAKQRMGAERWTHNPSPKLDYAARRREWEEELRSINEGIELLQRLNFLGLKTSRH